MPGRRHPDAIARTLGRYALYDEIGSGGMGSVHLGRLMGPGGFTRVVAIKRLHPRLAQDPEFVTMFLDEARIAARIRHANVVATVDVVAAEGELFLVMEYVQGEELGRMIKERGLRSMSPPLASAILIGVLNGLHAAHEATDDRGAPIGIVHRDVSPDNILIGVDGIPRVLDFGIAKAAGRSHATRRGYLKGKLRYMAPEQLCGEAVTRQTDVYAAGVVLWELLAGRRLFDGKTYHSVAERVMIGSVRPPSAHVPGLSPAADDVVMTALAGDRSKRFRSAREMALALEQAIPPASATQLGHWVSVTAQERLAVRAERVASIEGGEGHDGTSVRSLIGRITGDPELDAEPPTTVEPQPLEARPRPRATVSFFVLLSFMVLALFLLVGEALAPERTPIEVPAKTAKVITAPTSIGPSRVEAPNERREANEPTPVQRPRRASAPRRAKKTAPRPECDPPYYRDEAGIIRFRLDCPEL